MGTQAAFEEGVAINVEMVSRDRRSDILRCGAHEIDGVSGGDVLEDDLELWEAVDQRAQHRVDKDSFAVEDVDLAMDHLAVDEQGHADRLHALEDRVDLADVADPSVRVGGRARGVELAGGEGAVLKSGPRPPLRRSCPSDTQS